MAKPAAERMRDMRARQREAAESEAAAAGPAPDGDRGEVLEAVEASLKSIRDPDPVLSALARRMASHIDSSQGINHQVAAELRRTMNDLRGKSRGNAAGSGLSGGRQRVNKVSDLRRDYQSARSKRSAS